MDRKHIRTGRSGRGQYIWYPTQHAVLHVSTSFPFVVTTFSTRSSICCHDLDTRMFTYIVEVLSDREDRVRTGVLHIHDRSVTSYDHDTDVLQNTLSGWSDIGGCLLSRE
jgi:hypothetical protein